MYGSLKGGWTDPRKVESNFADEVAVAIDDTQAVPEPDEEYLADVTAAAAAWMARASKDDA